eukprot:2110168-Pyramimonas_sp.AAC.1
MVALLARWEAHLSPDSLLPCHWCANLDSGTRTCPLCLSAFHTECCAAALEFVQTAEAPADWPGKSASL